MRLLTFLTVVFVSLTFAGQGLHAADTHVAQDGTGDFTTIHAAIDAAVDGDTVVVHPGTYCENIEFKGKNIVLRSTAPEDKQIVAATIIDGGQKDTVVTFAGTEDESCLLSGFTITNGRALYGGGIRGGGMVATISNCTISDNSAYPHLMPGGLHWWDGKTDNRAIIRNSLEWSVGRVCDCQGRISDYTIRRNSDEYSGGGLYYCDGTISNCTVTGNWSEYGGGLCACNGTISNCTINDNFGCYGGGGLYGCDGTISSCMISGNDGSYGGGLEYCCGPIRNCTISDNRGCWGGGLWSCNGAITNCRISGNSSWGEGGCGGLAGCGGTISNCSISGNSSDWYGGGLYYWGGTISNCTISDNSAGSLGGGFWRCFRVTIKNCTITGNSAGYQGGGLDSCAATMSSCTITGNSAAYGGGGLCSYSGTINNCIVWANEAPDGPELDECNAAITYSCIRDWTGGGEGNISDDPLFVKGPLRDYYLSCKAAGQTTDSPCIDKGSATAESLGLAGLTTRTDQVPDSGIVDMGCHYILALDQNPRIECSLNQGELRPGDLLVGFIEAQNPGPDVAVDAYVAFVLPDGALISLTSGGLAIGTHSWTSNVVLPGGFHFRPTEVLRTSVPNSPGSYLFAAALTQPGQFDFIGGPSLFPFTIKGGS
ncbi:MAG: right-handed parallel beta-helix repeat-containing protein [Candidatus Coatesbacteria bacterium]|nr:right-handed parallel beta-helix repeat-containing protein [Candidatus Coatesbacteria bacterium]